MLEHRTEPLRLKIRHLLYPLLTLYATSYALLLQQSFPPQSQVLLIIKLVVGAAILCASSFFLLKKSGSKVQFMPHRIDWTMVTYCVVLALFLLYLFVWFNLALFPGVYPKTISYYGPFDIVSPLYLPILLAMSVYVLGEELFFKGRCLSIFPNAVEFFGKPHCCDRLFCVGSHESQPSPRCCFGYILSYNHVTFYRYAHFLVWIYRARRSGYSCSSPFDATVSHNYA